MALVLKTSTFQKVVGSNPTVPVLYLYINCRHLKIIIYLHIKVELEIFKKVMLKFKDTMNDKCHLSIFTSTIGDSTTLIIKEGNLT